MIDHYSVTSTNCATSMETRRLELTLLNAAHLEAWQEGLAAAANAHPEAFILNENTLEEARRYFFTA